MAYLRHAFLIAERVPRSETENARRQRRERDRQEKERQDKAEDRATQDFDAFVAAATVAPPAPPARIEAFDRELTEFEIDVVKALLQNEEAMERVQLKIDKFLERAFVMPDGRRVFRTEDGTKVFDEFGEEVGPEELDPDMIPEGAPTWEAFNEERGTMDRLVKERTELLEYQEKLDAARDEINGGEISEADLDSLEADLIDAMPPSLKGEDALPDTEQHQANAGPSLSGAGGAEPLRSKAGPALIPDL
jgi:hypothetical protein